MTKQLAIPTILLSILFLVTSSTSAQQFLFPEDYQKSLAVLSSSEQQQSCVILEQCGSLLRMWESRYIMMNALEVLGTLERAHCGFLGFSETPVFRCPEDPQNLIRRMFIGDGPGFNQADCAGTVKVFIDDDPEPQLVAHESMEKIKMVVDRVMVTGNCCWRLHSKKSFRGRSLSVRPGATHAGIGTVKSIKKLDECPEML